MTLLRMGIFVAAAFCSTFSGAEPMLGLSSDRRGLTEGRTDYGMFLRPIGTVRAVMLFAQFPDAEIEESTHDLYDRLVPEAIAYFERVSHGRLKLEVVPHHEWYPMESPSTSPGYDCSKFASHRAYVAEAVGRADGAVDFSGYDIVYVVGSRNPGTRNSPTLLANPGDGVEADGVELRHAVTFGNDTRGPNWGWQTLVHETGHIFGLPDLYRFEPATTYKEIQGFSGGWDPMGYQAPGSQFLAWHKHKLGWLDEGDFRVVSETDEAIPVSRIDTPTGIKAVVVPFSEHEAYVAEMRALDPAGTGEAGVLLYRVSTMTPSGHGPIRVIPAAPDDGSVELEKRYITLYNALFREGTVLEDADRGIRIAIVSRSADACVLSVRLGR